jgi:hypothetical protein
MVARLRSERPMTILHIGTRTIHDLVRSGRITPAEGALLIEEIEYARKPRWERVLRAVVRAVFG